MVNPWGSILSGQDCKILWNLEKNSSFLAKDCDCQQCLNARFRIELRSFCGWLIILEWYACFRQDGPSETEKTGNVHTKRVTLMDHRIWDRDVNIILPLTYVYEWSFLLSKLKTGVKYTHSTLLGLVTNTCSIKNKEYHLSLNPNHLCYLTYA